MSATKNTTSSNVSRSSFSVAIDIGLLIFYSKLITIIKWSSNSELAKETNILLKFRNDDLEREFNKHSEPMSTVPIVAFVLVTLNGTISTTIIIPR